jgi:hypothetical protein
MVEDCSVEGGYSKKVKHLLSIMDEIHKVQDRITAELAASRERALVLTKLDEALLWLSETDEMGTWGPEHGA